MWNEISFVVEEILFRKLHYFHSLGDIAWSSFRADGKKFLFKYSREFAQLFQFPRK
jgi:hypothetical protein